MHVHKLIVLGLVLCNGTPEMKVRVLYDILQDNMQERISANDKDFKSCF